MTRRFPFFIPVLMLAFACNSTVELSDPEATSMAKALFSNLEEISRDHVLVAHQDALAYGMGWKGDPFRTDIHDVCGDHPALFGWDLGHLGDAGNIDGVPFDRMKEWALAAYEKGGIHTYSWHMRNYAINGSSWDTESCVEECLPGGLKHDIYLEKLDLAVEFFSGLRTTDGDLIPVVFRPFHEMNGDWFWWGRASCTTDQYKEIFRFTVDYLREKGMHQLLIAYSPDVFDSREEYLTYYPGDDYVDILGFDDYHKLVNRDSGGEAVQMLEIVAKLATEKGKLTAITETGVETIPDPEWFTGTVLPVLKTSAATRGPAWILFWRNGRPDHFYGPHPEHPSAPDFVEFTEDDLMLTLSELPHMYGTDR